MQYPAWFFKWPYPTLLRTIRTTVYYYAYPLRQALEAKALIYEKLSKGQGLEEVEGQDGEESRYMVDFTRKVYDRVSDLELKLV